MEDNKKKKKRLIVIMSLVLCALILCIGVLIYLLNQKRYSIIKTDFIAVVAHNEDVDYGTLQVKNDKTGQTIPVEQSMIISCDETDTIGQKTLIIEYDGVRFTVNFEVKYKVEYLAKDQVVSTQFVYEADEIVEPDAPTVSGYEFIKWDFEIPQEINSNLQFNAVLSSTTLSVPALKKLSATYGDTLADITLPSNQNGAWTFVDSLSTKVGDCGEREFDVKFVPTTSELVERTDKVKIEISQKQLEFVIDTTSFVYDGEPHFPTYSLSEDVNVQVDVLFGEEQTEASDTPYQYSYIISDHNYSGYISGTFTISKANVTVTIQDSITDYGTAPEIKYTIEGFDNESLLGLSLIFPSSLNAGTYKIDATCTNSNVKLTVNKGTLTVNPIYLNPAPANPTLSTSVTPATYGDLLSSVTFGNAANGVWTWKQPNTQIDKVVGFKATAVFTPTSSNYKQEERELDITNINKKTLSITVDEQQNTHTYDGNAYSIVYNIENGAFNHLQVDGNVTHINANTYTTTLTINNEFYQGEVEAKLVIKKAIPQTNFITSYTRTWFKGITLNSLDLSELGQGYSWENSNYSLDQIKTHTAIAVFTPQDTTNYEIVKQEINITINKAQAEINNVESSYNFVYSGNEYMLSGITPSHYEEELIYSFVRNNVKENKLQNAGEYNVTITLPESTHYLPCTKTTVVTIEQAELSVVLGNLSAVYEDTLGDVVLLSDSNGEWAWKEALTTSVGTVGQQKHVAIYTPFDSNYKTVEFTAIINVSAKQLYFAITNHEYTYSGEQKTVEYTLTDSKNNDYSHLDVKGNTPYVNVGTYNLTLEVENTNYNAKKDTTLIINKLSKTPDIPTNLTAVYLDTLADVTFPTSSKGQWKWMVSQDTMVGNAGTNQFDAMFVYYEEDGLDNLNDYTTKLSIKVSKYTLQVPTLKQTSVVYDGQSHTAKVDASSTSLYSVTNNIFTDVGNYKVELTLSDANNYIWSNGDTKTTYLDFEIEKAQAEINDLAISNWTYGQTASEPSYTYSTFVPSEKVLLEYIDEKNNSSKVHPSLAGRYTLKVSIADTQNYLGVEKSVNFEIYSATVEIPTLKHSSVVYDAQAHTVEFNDFDGRFYSIPSYSFTDVGEYKLELTLNDTDNYVWSTGNSENIYLDFAITIAQAEITKLEMGSWIYGQNPETPVIEFSKFVNIDDITVELVDASDAQLTSVPTTAGSYKIKMTIATTANYLGEYKEVTFEIYKAKVFVPTLEKTSVVYNGQAHTAKIIDNVENNSSLYTVTAHEFTVVGEYKIELVLKDSNNYIWSNGDEGNTYLDFAITIANAEITTLEMADWIYGKTASTPNIVYSNFVEEKDVLVQYFDSKNSLLDSKPSTVGKYTLKVTISDNANYNGTAKSAEFEIISATVIVPILEKSSIVYDGQSHSASIVDNVTGNSSLYTVTTHSYTNVGEYKIELVLKDANYVWSNGDTEKTYLDFAITIAQAEISTLAISNWTYGKTASILAIEYSDFVIDDQVTIEYIDELNVPFDTLPSTAGKYTIQVTIPQTGNYHGTSKTFDFEIYKATVEVPEIKSAQYTGEKQTANISSTDLYLVVENEGGIDYGEYDVVLEIKDFDNYKWAGYETKTITLTFEIATAINEWKTYPSIASWIYGKPASTPVYEETFGTAIVVYKGIDEDDTQYSTTTKSEAGKYIAKFYVVGNNDYSSLTALVEFEIYQAEVIVPSLKQTTTLYDSTTHNAVIVDEVVGNSSLYNVTKNGFVEVGKHKVELTLKDNKNYIWSNGNTLTTTLDFEITINQAQINTLEISDWIYGNAASTPTIVYSNFVNASDVTIEYIDKNNASSSSVPVYVGSYTLKVTIQSGKNYTGTTGAVIFKITKATVTVPSLQNASIVYDGSEHTPVVVDTDEENKKLYTYTVQTYTNVISTNIELSLVDSANYIWSNGNTEKAYLSFEITVGKAEITTLDIDDWIFGQTAETPTIEYSDFVISTDVTIEYIDKANNSSFVAPSLVGAYILKVTIANDTNGNYTGTSKTTTFDITSATVTVPNLEETRVEYDGGPHSAVVVDSDEANKKLYTVAEHSFTNVGTHLITLTLKDSANYVWSNGDKTTTTLNFVIYQTQAKITTLTATSKPYDGSQVAVNIAYSTFVDAKTVSVVYIDQNNNQSSVAPHLVGNYTLKVIITGNENYLGCEKEVTFSITSAAVTVPTLQEESVVYDGDPHSAVVVDSDEANKKLYTIADHNFTNVGTHSVILTLKDSANYVWANGDEISTNLEFVITIATPEITINISNEFTYGQAPSVHSITYSDYVLDSDVTITYTDSKNNVYTELPTQAGSYTLTVTIADDANGNYKGITKIETFNIIKAQVTVPSFTPKSVTYNGGTQVANVALSNLYTVTQNGWKDVGNYKVKIKLNDTNNYVWSNGNSDELALDFAITPAQAVITKLEIAPWTYSQTPSEPKLTASSFVLPEDISYVYTDTNGTVIDKPTDVGSYNVQAIIADDKNGNYKGTQSAEVPFTIDICVPEIKLPSFNKIYFNYNDDEYKKADGRSVTNAVGADITSQGTLTYSSITYVHGTNASTFTVTFTPNDTTNYQKVTAKGNVTVHSAALVGSTYYPTIESAVSANSSGTIYVLPDNTGNVIIKTGFTIPSGLTLVLLHGDYDSSDTNRNSSNTSTISGDKAPSNINPATYRKTFVTLAAEQQITVAGKLEVSGVISGGAGAADYAGNTAGNYAEIMMCASSKIIVTGTVSVTGYITEQLTEGQTSKIGNGSLIDVTTGSIGLPLVLRDFKGGSYMYAVYNEINDGWFKTGKHTSPFNQFQFININPMLKVGYNGTIIGYANLFANDEHHNTDGNMVGNTSKSLIQLTNSTYSYLTAKYDSTNNINDIDIYGGSSFNSLSLTLNVGFTITVSTEDVFFPICWAFDISLNRSQVQKDNNVTASFTITKRIKIMPGAVFTIGEGVNATMDQVHIYNGYHDTNGAPARYYPEDKEAIAPVFVVNGSLTCTTIGGQISSTVSGATIKATSATTITTNETTGDVSGKSFLASVKFTTLTNSVTLLGSPNVTSVSANTTYTYNGTTWTA